MDTNIIFTWSIIILTTIALVAFFYLRNNRTKTPSALDSFALESNSSISSYDSWNKTMIGIDNTEINKLFFIRKTPNQEYKEEVCLSDISNCRMVKTERTVTYNKSKMIIIDKINLIFSYKNFKTPDLALEFYNTDYDQLTISGELQLAQKWAEIVKKNLVTSSKSENVVGKLKFQSPAPLKEQARRETVPS